MNSKREKNNIKMIYTKSRPKIRGYKKIIIEIDYEAFSILRRLIDYVLSLKC